MNLWKVTYEDEGGLIVSVLSMSETYLQVREQATANSKLYGTLKKIEQVYLSPTPRMDKGHFEHMNRR